MPRKLNTLKPVKGMFVEAYTSDARLGAGIHSFMVLKVGRKYVELFYAPQLFSLKLTWREWDQLALVDRPIDRDTGKPKDVMTDKAAFLARLQYTLAQYRRNQLRFSEDVVRRAIETCGGNYVAPLPINE